MAWRPTVNDIDEGYVLRRLGNRRTSVVATRAFARDDIVIVGQIEKFLDRPRAGAEQIGEHIYVMHGGLVGKVNHSCDPNVGIRLNDEGAHDFVAMRAIDAGEEITFDAAMRNYENRSAAPRCRCGAPNCRGRITAWKELPAERKAIYRNYAAPYLLALDWKYSQ